MKTVFLMCETSVYVFSQVKKWKSVSFSLRKIFSFLVTQELKQWDVTPVEINSTFSRHVWNSVATKKNQENKNVFSIVKPRKKNSCKKQSEKKKIFSGGKNQMWSVETVFCNIHSERPVVTRGFFRRSFDFSVMAGNKITSWSFNI